MINRNYGKLIEGYPQRLCLPVQLAEDITINGIVHTAGSWLSTDDTAALFELGYKPITRTEMPVKAGYFYTEQWEETETAIMQVWEEHQRPVVEDDDLTDAVNALETLGYTEE